MWLLKSSLPTALEAHKLQVEDFFDDTESLESRHYKFNTEIKTAIAEHLENTY